jgi:hypothetical protein
MFFYFIPTFFLYYLLSVSSKQIPIHLTKEFILHKNSLIHNEGLDIRKNNLFEKDYIDKEKDQLILIVKYIEKKKLLDYLINKDNSLLSKLDKIEKCNHLLLDEELNSKQITPPCPNLGLKKNFDEFLSS